MKASAFQDVDSDGRNDRLEWSLEPQGVPLCRTSMLSSPLPTQVTLPRLQALWLLEPWGWSLSGLASALVSRLPECPSWMVPGDE